MRYSNYSPTSSQAIGHVERELRQKRRDVEKLRLKHLAGTLTPEEERAARARFRGIFRSLLEEVLR